jgi:RNA polymerase sigma factor (sigma-70 family)
MPQDLRLSTLTALAIDARHETILAEGRAELEQTRHRLQRDYPFAADNVETADLAWAVASAVRPDARADTASVTRPGGYARRWRADDLWQDIWSALAQSRVDRHGADETTLLFELACSAACEQRPDWRRPGAPPLDLSGCNAMFQAIYDRYRRKVSAGIAQRFGQRAGDPDTIANDAWTRTFDVYWSAAARRRFCGLSRISTLVSQVAWFVAVDALRAQNATTEETEDRPPTESLAGEVGLPSTALDRVAYHELRHRVFACLKPMPARRQLIAHLVWLQQYRAVEVAALLRISEPAVARHLKQARDAMAECLRQAEIVSAAARAMAPAPKLTSAAFGRLNRRDD